MSVLKALSSGFIALEEGFRPDEIRMAVKERFEILAVAGDLKMDQLMEEDMIDHIVRSAPKSFRDSDRAIDCGA
jgi:hypothetical protein